MISSLPAGRSTTTGMAGTNERRESMVDDGWEPIRPEGPRMAHIVMFFAAALIVLPLLAFFASYMLLSR